MNEPNITLSIKHDQDAKLILSKHKNNSR